MPTRLKDLVARTPVITGVGPRGAARWRRGGGPWCYGPPPKAHSTHEATNGLKIPPRPSREALETTYREDIISTNNYMHHTRLVLVNPRHTAASEDDESKNHNAIEKLARQFRDDASKIPPPVSDNGLITEGHHRRLAAIAAGSMLWVVESHQRPHDEELRSYEQYRKTPEGALTAELDRKAHAAELDRLGRRLKNAGRGGRLPAGRSELARRTELEGLIKRP